MLIAVIGGKLQGVEAVYLAQKAGYQTLLIDKNSEAPAVRLCDHFLEFEFNGENPIPFDRLQIDLILPAVEDDTALSAVKAWAEADGIPLAFDPDAYSISSSKIISNALFQKMNFPAPKPWPGCNFPVVIKPDQASGSRGVEVFFDPEAFFLRFPGSSGLENLVVQEYLDGPSYSIEIIGSPGNYESFQVTGLEMDTDHDCRRVTAPVNLSPRLIHRFEDMAVAIAEEICLTGIMDLEAVFHENEFKLLEIDARLPSQTPMAVYWSTGINMVGRLAHLVFNNKDSFDEENHEHFVIVEHIQVSDSEFNVLGEHIMDLEGPLKVQAGFFGANEAVTSYSPGKNQWVATMIFCGNKEGEVIARRKHCYNRILEFISSDHEGQLK